MRNWWSKPAVKDRDTTVEPSLVTPTSSFPYYENTTFGIRVKYPSNWTTYESQNGSSALIVQFAEGPYSNNSSYTEEPSSGGLAIREHHLLLTLQAPVYRYGT